MKLDNEYMTTMSQKIYQQNKAVGWWDDDRSLEHCIALVCTEIAEATEGVRKDLMDDKLLSRKMEEVELADACIRLFDAAGHFGLNPCYSEPYTDNIEDKSPLECHFILFKLCGDFCSESLRRDLDTTNGYFFHRFILTAFEYAESRGYDLFSAIEEKLEFNKHRADHKRENRAKEGGKKF